MRIYRSKIPIISDEIVVTLVKDDDIEVEREQWAEVSLDIQAILSEYLRREDEVNEEAKDLLESRGLPYSQYGKMRRAVCKQKQHRSGDDGMEWILDQVLESFMVNNHVQEVYAENHEMRRKMVEIFKKHLVTDEQLDQEVRERLKHVEEGTASWEVEYRKALREIKRKHGIA